MDSPLRCRLIACSLDARVEQIHTGLAQLHRAGRIRLRQTVLRHDPATGRRAADIPRTAHSDTGYTRLAIDGGPTLHFDLADGDAISPTGLAEADVYFKRSYSPTVAAAQPGGGAQIRPLGLNLPFFPDFIDRFAIQRTLHLLPWSQVPAALVRAVDTGNRLTFLPRDRYFGALPDYDAPPRALFLVRAWDPHDDPARPPEKVAEFHAVNETRAACIRALRSAFGDRFLGGFSHTPYAVQHYGDVLAPSASLTTKRSYFSLLARYPICVATTGLHGSIGWKVGEYTGLAKAIVTEPLCYTVPGGFGPGSHYLEFADADQCAAVVARLFDDAALRRHLMEQSLAYYREWVRADQLVWHAIQTALSR